jgi:predicted heme/steroid binding protein
MSSSPKRCPAAASRPLLVGYLVMAFLFAASAVLSVFAQGQTPPPERTNQPNLRTFTLKELAAFDGKDGRPAYAAYEGLIYDFSSSPLFKEGEHYQHLAGQDLTGALAGAPHGTEVFAAFPVVGKLIRGEEAAQPLPPPRPRSLLFLGKNLTAWSGYLLGLFFVLNFTTCYVMPWCTRSLPWHGTLPGPDRWDRVVLKLSYYHRYFAWLTVIFGILHGVLGIFQSFGIRV